MTYLEQVNHPNFREACKLTHQAEKLLVEMGLTRDQAHGWIRAWASYAGDGDGGDDE